MKFVIESAGLTVAGGKELAIDLMIRLAGHTEHAFTFIVPDLGPYRAFSGANIRKIVCKRSSDLVQRAFFLNYEVPRICRETKADALLCLSNFAASRCQCPTLVLLQNAWLVYEDPGIAVRRTLRERLITAYGRHSYRHLPRDITIVTQTRVMKSRLCARYGIDPRRVVIIPNACSFDNPAPSASLAGPEQPENSRPYRFLCLARYYPHKNIEILQQAAERLPAYTSKSAECIITIAPQQHPAARKLLAKVAASARNGRVKNIGPVESEELPEVYRAADALIHPALLESCSRTYLEAMHFGLPILTSDRDFARESCRDAAVYFDPLDADSVAKTMAGIMEDQALRERLVQNGLRVLAHIPTWDDIAGRFVAVLEDAARGLPPTPVPDEVTSWAGVIPGGGK
jgi:glycosyltransferase involved in cell wall biosynthesis